MDNTTFLVGGTAVTLAYHVAVDWKWSHSFVSGRRLLVTFRIFAFSFSPTGRWIFLPGKHMV